MDMPNKKRLIDEFIELVKIDSLTGKEKTLANLLVKNSNNIVRLGELSIKPNTDVNEILDFLDAYHIKKAVATTTRRELTEERLKRVGVYDRFDYVLCGDEVINRKPDPEIYLSVLKKMATDARNALVLEDSVVGVEAAYRAGIDCIQVPDIIAPTDVQKKQTIYTAKDLIEAKDYIKENIL